MRVSVIKIFKIHANLIEEQVFTCRVLGDEETITRVGRQLWTTWMHQNPGVPSQLIWSGVSGRELGNV